MSLKLDPDPHLICFESVLSGLLIIVTVSFNMFSLIRKLPEKHKKKLFSSAWVFKKDI